MFSLHTSNPEQLIYQTEILTLTVLGGIRLEGLDRMRVTLKAELTLNHADGAGILSHANGGAEGRPPVRHNLDLYNDTQVEKFIRRAAEKLEVGTSVIAALLSQLTGLLEQYRLEQITAQKGKEKEKKQLTPAERQAALSFLTAKDLLLRTNDCIGKSGVIGEELNRLIMFLIFTSRKRETPLHVVSLGSSGTGKTHLQEKVGQLVPEEERIEITTLSENAFYYFGQRELKHRVVLIEDLDGAENVLYPLRELMSKRKISKTVAHKNTKGETKTLHLVVEGPVTVAGCTTQEAIYEDNANRSFLLYLDESPEQDEKIMQYQRAVSAGRIDHQQEREAQALLQNCQYLLEPVKVKNPYAEFLHIPVEVLKPRRSNKHYLDFIETITFYHQYQREQKADEETGEIYIETTLEDIAQANRLMKEVLLRKSDEVSGACRNYFERLKKWLKERNLSKVEGGPLSHAESVIEGAFTNAQARAALRENPSNQKRYMIQLQQAGLIAKTKGNRKKGFYYEVVSMEEYEQRKARITGILDEILDKLPGLSTGVHSIKVEAVQRSQEVHRGSEPLKPA